MVFKFIDLTRPLSPTTTSPTIYPGDPLLRITPHATIKNDGYSVHSIHLGTHTSTHVDAPAHFVEGGRTIDEVKLEELIGQALIVDLSSQELKPRQRIEWEDLENAWKDRSDALALGEAVDSGEYTILLVHTGWKYPSDDVGPSNFDAHFFDHPFFSPSIATRLLAPYSKVRLFGSDTPNPDETLFNGVGGDGGYKFHEVFLGGNGLIAENLTHLDQLVPPKSSRGVDTDNPGVPAGRWVVNIVPLKIMGVDGSPVRAFAYLQVGSKS